MAKADITNCDNLPQRKSLFVALGGLPETVVKNNEWLYMLTEETRQSLSIEGYFATEQELKAVLKGQKTVPEILNYYRMAQSLYDLASQNYHEGESRQAHRRQARKEAVQPSPASSGMRSSPQRAAKAIA